MALKNPNHPKKGSIIKVEPFKTEKSISKIKNFLKDKPLDLALFVVGINTNLRAVDLLGICNYQVEDLEVPKNSKDMPKILLREKKTQKPRVVLLNADAVRVINNLKKWKRRGIGLEEALFFGQRGRVTVPGLNAKVKSWARACGIKGNFGSHSLRKTFGYMKRQKGVGLPVLMTMFNHSSQKQTLDYLCVQEEEIKDAYWDVI